MKRAYYLALLLPVVAGCKPGPSVLAISPSQYHVGRAILLDEFNHQEITRAQGLLFLDKLQNGAREWQYRYGQQ